MVRVDMCDHDQPDIGRLHPLFGESVEDLIFHARHASVEEDRPLAAHGKYVRHAQIYPDDFHLAP
jgi:hypothetical protein